ncbi:hypothetical protein VOLCADRAFT_106523 [Volvox carteri f. nagariensis]|uniref:Chlorophyllase n=1 Tax=Volvox carteri f. nagariensis TaxID=3068 RepID=D8U7S8_VOLCA|nr:uncharacterized protein VOLCADRAFT_106523 [Volvox carteri f. nagariensis]EFJ44196.1 hypothetical protein VOLCADRAFT_106523 [Volvox carteri f. nagariensis]|eukprot:XP_002954790.1 hypothetical protein VOLCADRAFT_106523 [Volvox carteri f. nagariensis]
MALNNRWFLIFATSTLLLCSAMVLPAFAQDFSKNGNHTTKKYSTSATPLPYNWTVDITYPTDDKGGPFPLIFMFNGMEASLCIFLDSSRLGSIARLFNRHGTCCQAAWYTKTVEHVASWGYVIVQYTTGIAYPLQNGEKDEVKVLAPLLEWLKSDCPIKNKIDFSRKAVMGHSRGGKLASLHYATRSDVATAVLIDPVDCSPQALGPTHPSAIAKLVGLDIDCSRKPIPSHGRSDKSAAVIGSGYRRDGIASWLLPSCTPDDNNATAFSATLSDKSWYISMVQAGHMQFAESNGLDAYAALNLACGPLAFKISNADVISEARTMAVAWFESVFRPGQSTKSGLQAYMQHLQTQSRKGVLTYRVPGAPPAAPETTAAEAVVSSATGGAERKNPDSIREFMQASTLYSSGRQADRADTSTHIIHHQTGALKTSRWGSRRRRIEGRAICRFRELALALPWLA